MPKEFNTAINVIAFHVPTEGFYLAFVEKEEDLKFLDTTDKRFVGPFEDHEAMDKFVAKIAEEFGYNVNSDLRGTIPGEKAS